MGFVPAINGYPIPTAVMMKVYHQRNDQWYRALKVNETIYCPQMAQSGYDWGFEYLGRIQGFTRCCKCSGREWLTLETAPNPYKGKEAS